MSWLYLPAAVADCSEASWSGGGPSATSSGMPTVSRSSRHASATDTCTTPRFGMMPGPSTGIPGLDLWMCSLLASRASRSASQEKALPNWMSATYGPTPFALFERSGPNGAYWRTSQASLPSLISDEFSQTWPKAGTTLGGIAFRLRALEHRTVARGSGLWPTPKVARGTYQNSHGRKVPTLEGAVKIWPTPKAQNANGSYRRPGKQGADLQTTVRFPTPSATDVADRQPGNPHLTKNGTYRHINKGGGQSAMRLSQVVKMFPTPNASDYRDRGNLSNPSIQRRIALGKQINLSMEVGGQLNPNWVEWLMGWPIGWTALEPLATDRFQQWLDAHGAS